MPYGWGILLKFLKETFGKITICQDLNPNMFTELTSLESGNPLTGKLIFATLNS